MLWLIYGEKNPELNPDYVIPDFKFLKSFLDSEIDCDKMDYLLRDSYYCGVNYGKYDLNRLLSSLTVYQNTNDNILQLAIERGGIHVFEEFVIARYFMFIQVYFHKTRRYLDNLLVSCISSVLPESKYPSDVDEYLKLDDDIIYDKIKSISHINPKVKQFLERDVMSCAYETPAHSKPGADTDIYNAIKKQLKRIPDCNILEDAATKMAHKIPVLEQYDADSGKGIPIIVSFTDKPKNISEESVILQSLIHQINIKRIYVDKAHKEEARRIVSGFFKDEGDEENE